MNDEYFYDRFRDASLNYLSPQGHSDVRDIKYDYQEYVYTERGPSDSSEREVRIEYCKDVHIHIHDERAVDLRERREDGSFLNDARRITITSNSPKLLTFYKALKMIHLEGVFKTK